MKWKKVVPMGRVAGVALAFVAAVSAMGQGVRLAPTLQKGKTLTYEILRVLRVEQTPVGGGTAVVTASEFEMVVRLDVGSVRADGTTEVGVQIQSLRITTDAGGSEGGGGVRREFVHPSAEVVEAPAEDAKGVEGDVKFEPVSALKMMGGAMVTSSPRIVVNREGGVGEILGLDALGTAFEMVKKSDRTVSRVEIESMGADAFTRMLAPIFVPAAPEPAARRYVAGDTWTVRRRAELGEMGTLVIDEGWTMGAAAAAAGVAIAPASAVVGVEAQGPRGIVSAAPNLKVVESSGGASLAWDVGESALEKFERKLEISVEIGLGDLVVKQKQASALKVSRQR